MCAENVVNAMEFAWTCRTSYGKPLDCVSFICRLGILIAIVRKLSEMAGDGRETQIILVGATMVAVVVRKTWIQASCGHLLQPVFVVQPPSTLCFEEPALPAASIAVTDVTNTGEPAKVLDIAAGHGLSRYLMLPSPTDAEITIQVWENVVDVARENAAIGKRPRQTSLRQACGAALR